MSHPRFTAERVRRIEIFNDWLSEECPGWAAILLTETGAPQNVAIPQFVLIHNGAWIGTYSAPVEALKVIGGQALTAKFIARHGRHSLFSETLMQLAQMHEDVARIQQAVEIAKDMLSWHLVSDKSHLLTYITRIEAGCNDIKSCIHDGRLRQKEVVQLIGQIKVFGEMVRQEIQNTETMGDDEKHAAERVCEATAVLESSNDER